MTLLKLPETQLPPTSLFLGSVCPGLLLLDDNIHFSIQDEVPKQVLERLSELNWPLTSSNSFPASVKARLSPSYLHVARPPFQHDVHKNVESNTYVSVPFHVNQIFTKVIEKHHSGMREDGGLHIGANVNPLSPDPYRLVDLNPGCLTSVIQLSKAKGQTENRNPFRNMTSTFNKILRMGVSSAGEQPDSPFHSLVDAIPEPSAHFISHPQSGASAQTANKKQHQQALGVFSRLLEFDSKSYFAQVKAPTEKLLVAANVNVINVFAIGPDFKFAGTKEINSSSSFFPLAEEREAGTTEKPVSLPGTQQQQQHPKPTTLTTTCKQYKKVVEVPILRLQLQPSLIVTSILTIVCMDTHDPMLLLGLNTGALLVINLAHLTYRLFDNLGLKPKRDCNADSSWTNVSVTSLAAITHTKYELLVVAGYANGEVIILDLLGRASNSCYLKREVGHDSLITFFKKFDLSPLNRKISVLGAEDASPEYIVGHFKLSHKPITSIASTISYLSTLPNDIMKIPFIIAIASDDGLVRLIDLLNTHNMNYGDPQNIYNHLIVSDVVASYFQDGVRHIEFSPDNRFFTIGGKGDLIEIFKMTYYNISGLINKKAGHPRGRSRSGTVNSGSSIPQNTPSIFLSTTESASTSTSLDYGREEVYDSPPEHNHLPPTIKDITIVSRLKGHSNTVEKVSFVQKCEINATKQQDDSTSRAYKLISCSSDGKIIIWDFDSKAVSRLKKGHFTTKRKKTPKGAESAPEQQAITSSSPSAPGRARPLSNITPSIAVTKVQHMKSRSLSHNDDNPFTKSLGSVGINKILSPSPQPLTQSIEDDEEKQNIVLLLYRWLYENRLKKHYYAGNVTKDGKKKYTSIIHRIVNDEELPSIQIPTLEIDMSYFLPNGKIQGYQASPDLFLIFGRNGDIFTYHLE